MRLAFAGRSVATLAGGILLAACYTYVPVDQPAPGSMVRVRVPVRSAIDRPNAEPQTVAIEGRVLSFGDSLVLESTDRVSYGAFRELILIDTFRVSRESLAGIESQEFSKPRTIVLTVVITGGTALFAASAIGLSGGGGGDNQNGGQPPIVGQLSLNPLLNALWRLAGG